MSLSSSGSMVDEKFLDRYQQAWSDHDPDAIVSMMTPDGVFEASTGPDPWGTRHVGREAIRQGIIDGMAKVEEPNTLLLHHERYIVGNHAFTTWTSSYTRPDGQEVCVHGCDFYEFRDGLVHKKIAYRKNEFPGYQPVHKTD